MMAKTTTDAFASGLDSSSNPILASPNPGAAGVVGVAGRTTGHTGTQSAAVVGA